MTNWVNLGGNVTVQRVLPPEGGGPKVETTFQISGNILEVETTMLGTYWSTVLPNRRLYGESSSLERLGSVAVLYEREVDENGGANADIWEWK